MTQTVKYKYISNSTNKNRYVIADIHGCVKTLRKLIEDVVKPNKSDQIFFLGDYIDRGPESGAVIDYILHLKTQGYDVYPLRGNHEENMLDAYKEYDTETFTKVINKMNKCPDMLDNKGALKQEYLLFMEALPYYFEMDDCYIVHGGFDFKKPDPFKDYSAMLNFYIDNENYDLSILKNKRMIHGHRVTEVGYIQELIKKKSQIISLDNGCVYIKKHKIYDYTKHGNLCCLNIDTMELLMQKNIE